MAILDPRLQFVQMQTRSGELRHSLSLATTNRFALDITPALPEVRVLLQFEGSLEPAEALGLRVTSVCGDVATGFLPLSNLSAASNLKDIVYIESSRPLYRELDTSVPDTGADTVWKHANGNRGAGVIVGVIDSGIDYRHESFLDSRSATRILAIWDQNLTPRAGTPEISPPGFGYGVEYAQAAIDAALHSGNPLAQVRHTDVSPAGHGTHISGIAAGNGRMARTYVGMAPEANIMVVAASISTNLGDSANTLDAVNYLFRKAAALDRPIVINISQGDNLGPHDGTSLLERGIDNLLGSAGRSIVKSAGNAGDDEIHAEGQANANAMLVFPFQVPAGDSTPDTIDIWYSGAAQLEVSLVTPAGAVSAIIGAPASVMVKLPNGNAAFIASSTRYPFNQDNRIYIQLLPDTLFVVEAGAWEIHLRETAGQRAVVNAWIEAGNPIPRFTGPGCTRNGTITVPGTSKEIITVGAYTTRGSVGVGDMCDFSSWGPSRDGSARPDVSAPGRDVYSAQANGTSAVTYSGQAGTSVAAPHVTGAIALLLAEDASLTQRQIRDHLVATARTDVFTGTPAGNGWGAGKLDVHQAWQRVMSAKGV